MILCIIILVRILRDRFHLEMGYLETSDWDIWYNLLTYNRRNIFSLQFLHKSAGNLEKSLFFFGFEVLSYIPLRRPYLAEILPIWRRTPSNQSINQSIPLLFWPLYWQNLITRKFAVVFQRVREKNFFFMKAICIVTLQLFFCPWMDLWYS